MRCYVHYSNTIYQAKVGGHFCKKEWPFRIGIQVDYIHQWAIFSHTSHLLSLTTRFIHLYFTHMDGHIHVGVRGSVLDRASMRPAQVRDWVMSVKLTIHVVVHISIEFNTRQNTRHEL